MAISSLINYKTANLLMIHGKYSDDDLPEMIQRMLGKKFHDLFRFGPKLDQHLAAITDSHRNIQALDTRCKQ